MIIVFACDMDFVIKIYSVLLYCIFYIIRQFYGVIFFFHVKYLNSIIYMIARYTQSVRNISNMHTIKFKVDDRYLLWDTKLKYNTRIGNSVTKQFYKVCSTRWAV
jgi:hypothetical protein